jgi:chromate transporter
MADAQHGDRGRLKDVAVVFLKLGTIGFGGPAGHVALMRREMIEKRRWLDEDRFLELFGASTLIPGPSSTELGMMLGYEHAGWPGLVVSGVCFIVPAVVIVLVLSWAYVRFGALPQTGWVLYGVEPVIVAVVADALWQLGGRALRSWPLAVLGAGVLLLYVEGVDVLVLLFGGAVLVTTARNARRLRSQAALLLPFLPLGATATGSHHVSLDSLFLEFLKLGAVVFGSGYVLLAFLRGDLVQQLHWLTDGQVVDAISVGQVTPGPVFTSATFIGYLVGGIAGALVATVAIFLPAFALSGVVYRLLPRIRRSPWAQAFLEGATVSGLGLMAGVAIQLGRGVIVDAYTAAVAIFAFFVLRRFQPNSVWLVLGGAAVGVTAKALGGAG